MSEIKNSRLGL